MADQAITALPKKTYSGSSKIASTDYLLGIDSAEGYQMLIQDLGEYIINRATANLAGSTQTLASAISALNSKTTSTISTGTGWTSTTNQCIKRGNVVEIYLAVSSSSDLSSGWNTIGTVPEGYRPTFEHNLLFYNNGSNSEPGAFGRITTNGTIDVYNSAGATNNLRIHDVYVL